MHGQYHPILSCLQVTTLHHKYLLTQPSLSLDGGTYVSMRINDKLVCQSNATYGGGGAQTIVDGKEWQTITKMSTCEEPITVKKGDNVVIAAGYDTEKHPLRVSNGEEQENMGIMTFVYVADK
jgi:hypothetical protein